MIRFAPGLFGVVLFALWIWAVLDVISTDRVLVRNLEKNIWLMLVIFVPTVGAVAWLAVGRPVNAGFSPGSTAVRQAPSNREAAPRGPEDRADWPISNRSASESNAAKERRLLEWEAELKKRESNLDDDA
jgi:hypothetical protein